MTIFDASSPDKTQETLRLHSRILELSHDAIIIWRLDGPIMFWNRGAESKYGYEADEAIGRSTHELLQTTHPGSWEAVRETLDEIGQWTGELDHVAKDGRRLRVSSRHQLVHNADGEILVLEINRNITESLQIRAELEEARAAAELANHSKSVFLANMSHELRTPLSAILGFADILLKELRDEANRERVQTIRSNGAFLLELLNDILDLSKIEAGKLPLKPEPVEVVRLMADVAALMRVRTEVKNLQLRFTLDSPVPKRITTDGRRLRQVLVNLLGNAVKFTERGEIVFAASVLPAERDHSARLMIRVEDTGVGIAPDDLRKIFKPFEQVDSRREGESRGTGLGLSISRLLAHEMGGDLEVKSELGVGSCFTLTLPMAHPSGDLVDPAALQAMLDEPAAKADEAESPRLDGRRVVVADDRRDIRHVAAYFLERVGAEVILAANGQEALDLVEAQREDGAPVDLVLMDMQMPVLDGYEATRRLIGAGFTGPVIALTAAAMKGERERCLAAGCSDYVAKPIDGASLVSVCASYLLQDE